MNKNLFKFLFIVFRKIGRMTLNDFNKGYQSNRVSYVWQHGTFLAGRPWQKHRVCLYHMGEFFAEVYYRVRDNQVDLVRGFKNRELLEPYLGDIDVSGI